MTRQLNQQVAIVTGAVGGIGSAIVERFVAEGASVGLVDFNADAGAAYADKLRAQGHTVCFTPADVGGFASCEAAYAAITKQLGAADIVVNNAGISIVKPALEMPEQDWDSVVDTNLRGAWLVAQTAGKRWAAAKRPGTIVNIASILGGGRRGRSRTAPWGSRPALKTA